MPHYHRYKFSVAKNNFEAVDPSEFDMTDLYRMVEYAYMMCDCGAVQKTPVAVKIQDEDL